MSFLKKWVPWVVSMSCVLILLNACSGDKKEPGAVVSDPTPTPTPGVAASLQIIGPDSASAGTCTAYSVQVIDSKGLSVAAPAGAFFSIPPVGSMLIFSDSTCSSVQNAFTPSSTGSAAFFIKDSVKELAQVSITTMPGSLTGTKWVNVQGTSVASLALSAPGSSTPFSCTPFTVTTLDGFGNTTSAHSDVTLSFSLSGVSPVAIFSDSLCASRVASATVPSGSESKLFFVQSNSTGTLALTVSGTGLPLTSANLAFIAGSSPRLSVVGPLGQVTATTCALFRVETYRADGSPLTNLGSPLPITVDATVGSGLAFFSNSSCTNALPASTVTVADGSQSQTFYGRATVAPQTVLVTANATGFVSGSTSVTLAPVAAASLALSNYASQMVVGQCGLITLGVRDINGNPSFLSQPVSVTLATGGVNNLTETEVFGTLDCSGAAITQFGFAACSDPLTCQSSQTLSFKAKKVGTANLVVSASGLNATQALVPIGPATGSPFQITLQAPLGTAAGECAMLKVKLIDSLQNPINSASDLSVTLSESTNADLFANSTCTTALAGAVTVLASTSESTFYFKNGKAETTVLTASSGALTAQASILTSPGVPKKLNWVGLPATAEAGRCLGPVVITQTDAFNNYTGAAVPFLLGGAYFYSDSQCSQPQVTGSFIATQYQSFPIYFSNPAASNQLLVASPGTHATLTDSAVANVLFTAAPSLALAMGCSSSDLTSASCSAMASTQCRPVYLGMKDSGGALFHPAGSSTPVTLSSSSTATAFYSDINCTTTLLQSRVTLDTTHNPVAFYVKSTKAENYTLSTSSGQGANTTLALSSQASAPFKLAHNLAVGSASFSSGVCAGPYEVRVEDVNGNLSPISSTTSLNFTASSLGAYGAGGFFYSDSACSTLGASVASGASTANYYIKSPLSGTMSVVIYASGLNVTASRGLSVLETASLGYFVNGAQVSGIDFGNVTQGATSLPAIVTLKNLAASDSAQVTLVLPAAPYIRDSSSTCSTGTFSLAGGASCTFTMTFVPSSAGAITSQATATYTSTANANSRTASMNLTGTGIGVTLPPFLSLASVAFGNVYVGSNSSVNATLQNNNPYPITINGTTGLALPYSITLGSGCGASFPFGLGSGSICNLSIKFSPTATGAQSGSLSFTSTNGTSNSAALSGTGIASVSTPAQLQWAFSNYGFGSLPIGSSSSGYVLISNYGQKTATGITFTNTVSAAAAGFTVSAGTCSSSLAPGSSCFAVVSFAPFSSGAKSSYFGLSYASDGVVQATTQMSVSGSAY